MAWEEDLRPMSSHSTNRYFIPNWGSIYGDSYFQMNIGEVANLAELTKTDSASNLETNSTNSFSSRLKNEDIKMPGTISARLCRAWFV